MLRGFTEQGTDVFSRIQQILIRKTKHHSYRLNLDGERQKCNFNYLNRNPFKGKGNYIRVTKIVLRKY